MDMQEEVSREYKIEQAKTAFEKSGTSYAARQGAYSAQNVQAAFSQRRRSWLFWSMARFITAGLLFGLMIGAYQNDLSWRGFDKKSVLQAINQDVKVKQIEKEMLTIVAYIKEQGEP